MKDIYPRDIACWIRCTNLLLPDGEERWTDRISRVHEDVPDYDERQRSSVGVAYFLEVSGTGECLRYRKEQEM